MSLVTPAAQGIKVTDKLFAGVKKVQTKDAITTFLEAKDSTTNVVTDTIATANLSITANLGTVTISEAPFSGINEFVVGQ